MRASGATDSDVTVPRASSCVDVTPQIVNGFVRCLNARLTGPPAPSAGAGGPAKTPPQTHCGTGSARSVAFVCPGAGDEGVLAFATSVNKAPLSYNGKPITAVAVTNDRDLAVASGKLDEEVSHCMCVYVSLRAWTVWLLACVCMWMESQHPPVFLVDFKEAVSPASRGSPRGHLVCPATAEFKDSMKGMDQEQVCSHPFA